MHCINDIYTIKGATRALCGVPGEKHRCTACTQNVVEMQNRKMQDPVLSDEVTSTPRNEF